MEKKLLDDKNYKDSIDILYCWISSLFCSIGMYIRLTFRLFIRFFAINYYFLNGINWNKCKKNKFLVYLDLQFIFWILRYYPENYYSCRLWKKKKSDWFYYYGSIYDPLQRKALRRDIHKVENIDIFENKYTCYCYCRNWDLPVPETIIVFNPAYSGFDRFKMELRENPTQEFILKFNSGKGGSGIMEPSMDGQSFFLSHHGEKFNIDQVTIKKDLILQEKIIQNEVLNKISKALNTIRIITLLKPDDDVCILGAYMRFGVGESLVDNLSSGGVGVKLNLRDEKLEGCAYDRHWNIFEKHPDSEVCFDGFELPYIPEILALVKKAQKLFYFHKLLGFDIAITPNGPVIVEINAEPDMIDFEVMVGPVLRQPDVYETFREYGLLINHCQLGLYGN